MDDRTLRQMKGLLSLWAQREAMLMHAPDARQEGAAAATLMCSNDLINALACDNPDCMWCPPAKGADDDPGR